MLMTKEDRNEAIERIKARNRQRREAFAEMAAALNTLVERGLELKVDDHGYLIAKPTDDDLEGVDADLDDMVAWLNDGVDAELVELRVDEHGHLHIQDLM